MTDLEQLYIEEEAFHAAVWDARKQGKIEMTDADHARCPICGDPEMDYCERGERMTWGGKEPPCIQYMCHSCQFGGEVET